MYRRKREVTYHEFKKECGLQRSQQLVLLVEQERKVERKEEKKKRDGRNKGSANAERKQGVMQEVTRCHS